MPMDICSHIGLPVTDDVKDLYGLCMHTLESTHRVTKALSEDELCNGVTEFLKIQDNIEDDSSSSPSFKNCEFQKKDVCDDSHPSKIATQKTPEEYPHKCATSPLSPPGAITSKVSTHDDNVKSLGQSGPTHLKPVSAMKGSREKRGAAPLVKLTVKWAPDVYDPIPTSVSHVVTSNKSSRHSKKNSKNKQKNGSKSSSSSSSRGSKGKDKKQVRKRGGRSSSSSSSMGYKMAEHEEEEMADFREEEMADFREHGAESSSIGFHEQFCGSSFLKRHGTSLHLSSVAEAT